MANTFKLKTNGAMPAGAGTPDVIYTVPAVTTAVIVGLTLANIHTTSVTATVQIVSATVDTETNETVSVIKDVPILTGSSLELMSGNKYVLQTGDIIKIDCSVSAKIDATLSVMEIT